MQDSIAAFRRADVEPGLIEAWAGFECSIVRIGDAWRNQLVETGHLARADGDVDFIAGLGIRTLRFPILWEMAAQGAADPTHPLDWRWPDERLAHLRRLGIEPIAGLVHHGSGPAFTSLLDPSFPELLADYALAVAQRYPWIDAYTPINEPLTTARFSCLYGHWYPHARSTPEMMRALVNECRAVVLAMRAVRTVKPQARLIQTEDMGRVFSTPRLRYQADYENERRWLSFDLICGRVTRDHPLREEMIAAGIGAGELDAFVDAPCPPDVIGINHYLTSDRYLDEDLERHPVEAHGGNAFERYADVAAVRSWPDLSDLGPYPRLMEAWQRYRRPLAITEVHNGATREEQLRWLAYVWGAARQARRRGADVRAVTIWAAAGCHDWSSLLTSQRNDYEPGLIDTRGGIGRATVLAPAIQQLARGSRLDHPVLDDDGWWLRAERFARPTRVVRGPHVTRTRRRLLVTGQTGTLGGAFARICGDRHLASRVTCRADMDIADAASVRDVLAAERPWAVINTAGFVRTAEAWTKPEQCRRENVAGAVVLAEACRSAGIPFVTFSSDLVFKGDMNRPYAEDDAVGPLCPYGQSKADAEIAVAAVNSEALIIRTSAFFGPWDSFNIACAALDAAAAGQSFACSPDEVSPTYVPDLVNAVLDLLIDGAHGTWHVANAGRCSWFDFLGLVLDARGVDRRHLSPEITPSHRCTALTSGRGLWMPTVEDAIARFARELERAPARGRG